MDYSKPLPAPTTETAPYWEAAREHRLVLQRCARCGLFRYEPAALCSACHSFEFSWEPVSGRGRVWSYEVYHRAYHPGFADSLPYTVAVVELAEGPRMITNIVECAPGAVRIDMPVEVVFDDVSPEITLPKFRPVAR